jgi:hypothetical protein
MGHWQVERNSKINDYIPIRLDTITTAYDAEYPVQTFTL